MAEEIDRICQQAEKVAQTHQEHPNLDEIFVWKNNYYLSLKLM